MARIFEDFIYFSKVGSRATSTTSDFHLDIVHMSLQLWRQMLNKKRTLNKMLWDNKENSQAWRQITLQPFSPVFMNVI